MAGPHCKDAPQNYEHEMLNGEARLLLPKANHQPAISVGFSRAALGCGLQDAYVSRTQLPSFCSVFLCGYAKTEGV